MLILSVIALALGQAAAFPAVAKDSLLSVSQAAAAETVNHDMTAGHDEAACPMCGEESHDCALCQEGLCANPACAGYVATAPQTGLLAATGAGSGFSAGGALSGLFRHTLPLPPP